jgi:molybdenum cofactor cytidylyltransferase
MRPQRDGRVVGVLLAAGGARRFGSQKLVHPVGGTPLVRRAAAQLTSARVDEVVVVVGSEARRVEEALAGTAVRLVVAEDWSGGMSASIRRGIDARPVDAAAAIIALGDQPAVRAEVVDALVDAWRAGAGLVVAPRYRGVVRPPVLFDRALFAELLALEGDRGARAVLEAAPERVHHVEVDADEPADVDELSDVERVERAEGPGNR